MIGTITTPIHIKLIPKLICIPNIVMVEPILKQTIKSIGVLVVKLVIPLDIVKQHLLEIFFHSEVGKMIIDETPTWEQVHDLIIVG